MNKLFIATIFLLSITFSAFFFSPAQIFAQSYGETLDITVTPTNPTPGAHVSLSVKDVAQNLDNKQISWSLNGKVVKQGVGAKNFEFDLGALGTVSSVTVSAVGLSKNIQIRPTNIDLIWETDGYVPPFYKGKALRVFQGNVRFVAIPHFFTTNGTELDPEKLVYTWRNSGILNAAASGYGKNTLEFSGSVISRPLNIEVSVASQDGTYKGSKEISVDEVAPSIFLYEDHPLYGVLYNNALNSKDFSLRNSELKVTAMPFNFSASNRNETKLKYSWSINGNGVSNPSFKDSVVLRKEGNATGLSNISLNLENQKEFMQASVAAFRVKFENSTQ